MAGHTPDEIKAARGELSRRDPALALADQVTPPFEWRIKGCGFPGLAALVIEQQVSTASAAAIWSRFQAGVGEVTPAGVLRFDELQLKTFGLSGQKARYVRGIAEATEADGLSFDGLLALGDEDAVAELTAIKGVGRWTAEAYLMGCEGRTDIFPAGDLALQEALRLADGLAQRPSLKDFYARAEAWRPYRGIAAHLLWGYYGAMKKRGAAPIAGAATA